MKPDQTIKWTAWAIIFGSLAMGAMLIWQLYGLVPARWCAVSISSAKMSGTRPVAEDCTTIILRLLDLKDHAIIGLLGVIGLSFLVMVVTMFKARVTWTGPAGIGGSVGGEVPFEGQVQGTMKTEEPK